MLQRRALLCPLVVKLAHLKQQVAHREIPKLAAVVVEQHKTMVVHLLLSRLVVVHMQALVVAQAVYVI
jgi:hypothetical protein